MIDFTGVTAITIPEGSVTKITRGAEVLWEKPSAEREPVIVFPKTTVSASIGGAWSTIRTAITFSRAASVGENYIIYLNGTTYPVIATESGGLVQLAVSNTIELTAKDATGTTFSGKIMGWVTSATLEIHYIP